MMCPQMDEILKVDSKAAGARLDMFLKEQLPDCSRKAAKRLLDEGKIRVNGRKVIIASWTMAVGDEVQVAESSELPVDVSEFFLKVLFEDDDILVVEKDAGVPCEESPLAMKPSLVQIINEYLKQNGGGPGTPYLGLIHRLDTETSGVMVYSKK